MRGSDEGPDERSSADLLTGARDAFVMFWTKIHEAVFEATGGQALNRVLGMTAVRVQVVGRKSGQVRTAMLTAPIADDDRVVLVASNGADPRHPQWFKNLLVHPIATVTVDGRDRVMKARVADEQEREALWREIRTVTPGYEIYQRGTSRTIPVVVLEPVEASSPEGR